jgi:REP element-mobilizing transposase RayT
MPQSFTCLHYHIVFSTKDRRPTIADDICERLYKYIGGSLSENKSRLVAVGGMSDHIHLLASMSKELSISDALRVIKTNSSKWVHETFPKHSAFAWQAGYAAFAVSFSNLDTVRRYIADQEMHHRRVDFKTEFMTLLKRHEIEFEETYLWE